MVKRGSKPRREAPVVQLQRELTRSLKDSVAETVLSVCEQFEDAVNEAASSSTSSASDYDRYYADCRRLVGYIQQNMDTSPGFSEQMDRIILACHSGATERVLSSVVTRQVYFHRRGEMPLPHVEEEEEEAERPTRSSKRSSSRASAPKKKVRPEKKTRVSTRASDVSPAMHTRSSTPTTGKRMATRGSPRNETPSKRPRRAAARKLPESSEEEKEEEEEQPVKSTKARRAKKTHPQPQEEDDDELLPFKDAIGELCYPDRRTPAETKFFKERLRKSIQFVDALLCKPPPGKTCGRGCKKIRAQMCSSSTPCKNKMCRIWHDVEAHTDRCQNPQCEFKNRILLRETMHKVEIKKQQMADTRVQLETRKAELTAIESATGDEEQPKVKKQWEKDIVQMEHALEEGDDELAVLEATKKTFWGILNDIGIEFADDAADEFPDFSTHYEDKKAPRKARAPSNPTVPAPKAPASGRSTRALRGTSTGESADNNDSAMADADADSAEDSIPQRPARRNTSGGPHESAEETKREDNDEHDEEEEQHEPEHDNNGTDAYNRGDDEPPLPPAGPPPFRQNPELDRTFALASGSGYSIQPPAADDLETPAIAHEDGPNPETEISGVNVPSELQPEAGLQPVDMPAELQQLGNVQQASAEISGALESLTSNPPADPVITPDFTIRGNQPQNP